jgi:hypothetical protein
MKNSKKERILKLIRQKKTIMQEKRKLAPVKVNWKAGAYGINIAGSEGEALTVNTIVTLADDSEKRLTITFGSFAEIRFFHFNFGEHNYNEFLIQSPEGTFLEDTADWDPYALYFREKGICPNPYFYEVQNTGWFNEKEVYQPLTKKGFKHFLLVGYDSYVEVLAKEGVGYELGEV